MAWSAKPSGGYVLGSAENNGNIDEIWSILNSYGYTMEAAAGVMGNIQAESGMNPWRWQGDTVDYNAGYGLYQYTKASAYIQLSGTMPNLSTSTTTQGASPDDGSRQTYCFASNELHKWQSGAWRPYWDQNTYATLYSQRSVWLAQFGNGSKITMNQYAQVTDLEAATFFILACFEGPAVPNLSMRYGYAQTIYAYLSGSPTPPAPPQPPIPPTGDGIPLWLLWALKNNLDKMLKT